jgi:hypothetical protein
VGEDADNDPTLTGAVLAAPVGPILLSHAVGEGVLLVRGYRGVSSDLEMTLIGVHENAGASGSAATPMIWPGI